MIKFKVYILMPLRCSLKEGEHRILQTRFSILGISLASKLKFMAIIMTSDKWMNPGQLAWVQEKHRRIILKLLKFHFLVRPCLNTSFSYKFHPTRPERNYFNSWFQTQTHIADLVQFIACKVERGGSPESGRVRKYSHNHNIRTSKHF